MSKSKKTSSNKKPGAPEEATTTPDDPQPFTARESGRLLHVSRFLVKVADPSLGRVRAKVAYTAEDHRDGWRLYRIAAGEGQPLDDASVPAKRPRDMAVGLFAVLDDFENRWFPRTRRIIERFVPESHRDSLLETFFRDLSQQPMGPLVVASVGTYLDRVEALEKSKVPGAAKVRAELSRRGVDTGTIARLRATIDEARALKPAPAASTEDPKLALRERRDAYDALWLWWKDWRETFASEVDGRLRRELGLVDTTRGPTDALDDEEEGEKTPEKPVTP